MGDGKKVLMTKVELMHDDYSEHLCDVVTSYDYSNHSNEHETEIFGELSSCTHIQK